MCIRDSSTLSHLSREARWAARAAAREGRIPQRGRMRRAKDGASSRSTSAYRGSESKILGARS
eukprot:9556732-Alexandrium_andersonii.AAC.1